MERIYQHFQIDLYYLSIHEQYSVQVYNDSKHLGCTWINKLSGKDLTIVQKIQSG
jgi:hypothetical protein